MTTPAPCARCGAPAPEGQQWVLLMTGERPDWLKPGVDYDGPAPWLSIEVVCLDCLTPDEREGYHLKRAEEALVAGMFEESERFLRERGSPEEPPADSSRTEDPS